MNDDNWKFTPSGLWETRRGIYGFEYRCTECKHFSEEFLKPSTRMHDPSCDRVLRGETKKPLVRVVEKGKRKGGRR